MATSALTPWKPLRPITGLRDAVDRLFTVDALPGLSPSCLGFQEVGPSPAMDIYEEGDHYVVEAELPGVDPVEVDISLRGRTLTIKGKSAVPEAGERSYFLRERCLGEFTRTVALPVEVDADKAEATFKHGTLHLAIPKAADYRAKRIPVRAVK